MVRLDHACCVFPSEEEARRTLGAGLGLRELRRFTLSPEVAHALFRRTAPLQVLVFGEESRVLEALIAPTGAPDPGPAHVCLVVDDLSSTLARCRAAGLEVRSASVGTHEVFFVADPHGNLFELKQASGS